MSLEISDKNSFQRCLRCVMDNIADHNISFNKDGYCNYCSQYFEKKSTVIEKDKFDYKNIEPLIEQIKREGKSKPYDSIIGISGGVDSSYLLYKMKELGLRPLAVHCDNGWNSEIAVQNIEKLISTLNVDLYTYVINWDEFKDVQLSFIKAGVIDIELISDHAIAALLYKTSVKFRTKYIFQGVNNNSEFILPQEWYHWKHDALNIKSIHSKFGKVPIKTLPLLSFFGEYYHFKLRKTKKIVLLDYIDYNKELAETLLTDKFGLKSYDAKHNESIFTRFYQNYILPVKFKVDKRKAHLSSLIVSGQITREDALEELKKDVIHSPATVEDKLYVLKKLGVTEKQFDLWMNEKPVSHLNYSSYLTKHARILKKIKGIFGRK